MHVVCFFNNNTNNTNNKDQSCYAVAPKLNDKGRIQ